LQIKTIFAKKSVKISAHNITIGEALKVDTDEKCGV